MRPPEEVDRVRELARGGLNHSRIARATGIPRSTVRGWLGGRTKPRGAGCGTCGHTAHDFSILPSRAYPYLLGIYLGDGTITSLPKGVWALRVLQDDRYPGIIGEISQAMANVLPKNRVRVIHRYRNWNCSEISSCSKSWPCLIPQAGPGMKHTRRIELAAWQWAYVWQESGMFLRGLLHRTAAASRTPSGTASTPTPRYFFVNESEDIQQLFRDACDLIGIEHRNNRRNSISVARRASVALLDDIVGPKR